MPIPDYKPMMLPLIKYVFDKKEHSIREAIEYLSNLFNLAKQDRK